MKHRRLIASIVLLIFLSLWIWGAATIGTALADGPKWAAFLFFVVAGIGWAFPLKPLFGWMNTPPDRDESGA